MVAKRLALVPSGFGRITGAKPWALSAAAIASIIGRLEFRLVVSKETSLLTQSRVGAVGALEVGSAEAVARVVT
jgi:hypothetical protein